ncbi:hypothetical protein KAOT1_17783 [Kordia algicida OT-1]|uniref:Uncharacterized protein n=2 Tax=Kordia TaxID=221065 RepID=A9DT84_9FLAO|nr:hypothetical protein KAOT1_17783 [Kordia algicida OT-1]
MITIALLVFISSYNCSSNRKVINGKTISTVASNNTDLLKSKLKLTDKQLEKILKNDSVKNQVILSLKDSLSPNLIRKHLDPYIAGKYSTKQTCVLLKLQTRFKGDSFELNNMTKTTNSPKFNSMEDLEKYIKQTDSLLGRSIKIKKNDSIKKKKN